MRQSKRRRARNLLKRETYKKLATKYKGFVSGKKVEEAKKMLPAVYKALDKAAKTNVIAKNKASRLKSGLARLLR